MADSTFRREVAERKPMAEHLAGDLTGPETTEAQNISQKRI